MWKDWSFWLSLVTVIVAIIALFLTGSQIRISNKQYLFDRRLRAYLIIKGLISLYAENKTLIECKRKDEPQFAIDLDFMWLTNNTYMEAQIDAIRHPLENPYHKEFLKKLEELRQLALEVEFIFKGKASHWYSEFVLCYEKTLYSMYQYQIIIDKMKRENEKYPRTQKELQELFSEQTYRETLYSSMECLKAVYKKIVNERADEKIEKQISLIWKRRI
jgi:hypothetical protein